MISNRSYSLRSYFLNLFLRLRFLFRASFVHTKMTLNNDQEYYKKDVIIILFDFITRFFESSYAHCDHHFLLVSMKLLYDLLMKVVCNESSGILENALFFAINRSSSMSFSKNRLRRRLLKLR